MSSNRPLVALALASLVLAAGSVASAAPATSVAGARPARDVAPRSALGIDVHVGASSGTTDLGDDLEGTSMKLGRRTGLNVGVGHDLRLGSAVSLHSELNYVEKGYTAGFNEEIDGTKFESSMNLRLAYLELPLLLKVSPLSGESVRPYAQAGPSIGRLVGRGGSSRLRMETSSGQVVEQTKDSSVEAEGMRFWDVSLQLGGGVDFDLGARYALLIDVRYTHGFTDLESARDEDVYRNRTYTLSTGVRF